MARVVLPQVHVQEAVHEERQGGVHCAQRDESPALGDLVLLHHVGDSAGQDAVLRLEGQPEQAPRHVHDPIPPCPLRRGVCRRDEAAQEEAARVEGEDWLPSNCISKGPTDRHDEETEDLLQRLHGGHDALGGLLVERLHRAVRAHAPVLAVPREVRHRARRDAVAVADLMLQAERGHLVPQVLDQIWVRDVVVLGEHVVCGGAAVDAGVEVRDVDVDLQHHEDVHQRRDHGHGPDALEQLA
mmetsp:Transcript_76911/g.193449  ORF Transcript_76911/g.193449 Transcript_76911/m.193449 type:complete len:242 (-) Transcript_76911:60-785(-)